MTDTLERLLQDLRFDVPAGLVERAQAAAAADAAGGRQAVRRVHGRGDFDTQRQSWAPALLAVLLAVAIVAALLGVRALHSTAPTPANRPLAYHHNGYVVVGFGNRLVAIDPATAGRHTTLSASANEELGEAAYSPDGTKLAYVKGGTSFGGGSIWVLDTASASTKELTRCGCDTLSQLSWSPDGSRLAFTDLDRPNSTQLYLINADGTHKTQLTHFPAGEDATQPSWSPDGTRLVFKTQGDGNIDVIRADGSGLGVLIGDLSGAWYPTWSPDGSRIAYVFDPRSSLLSRANQLWLMDSDGSQRTQIFVSPECCLIPLGGPAWSPDGTRIAVLAVSFRYQSLPGSTYTLWVMNADGSRPTRLGVISSDHPVFGVISDRPAWQPVP